ncbi:MAG: hypothetical protein KA886_11205, partial [Candidatus Cloacimonetes bacterium]|nr:hypothetical protein [Candidatus Cloacimonadota bacterium]
MSGDIKITGLATGIDFEEMTTKLVEAEAYQAKKLETWKTTWQKKIDALTELNTKISSIITANNSLKTRSSFVTRLSSSSSSSVADIAVDSSTPLGSYKLEVASSVNHKTASKGVESLDVSVAQVDSTLKFNDGEGNTIEVNLTIGMTLEDVRDAIDNELSAQGSNASVSISN